MSEYEAKRRAEAKRLLALVASGDAVELKYFFLHFMSGESVPLAFEPEDFADLCDLLGSDSKGSVEFTVWSSAGPIAIWLRVDVLCFIQESRNCRLILVDDQVEYIDPDDLEDADAH